VDFLTSDHKDRFCAIAQRRRIEQLVVVAGPTASGKSTLISRLQTDAVPEIALRAGIDRGADWLAAGSKDLASIARPVIPRLIFHYDFLRPYLRSAKVHARDEGLDVFDCAERVTTFTLVCSAAQLREQLHRGEIAPSTFFGRHVGPRRHRLLEREYADPDRVREHYRRWFDHLRTRPGEHRVVSLDGGTRVRPIAEWESALDDAAGAPREPRR
jgi:hypothetical protein